MKKGEGGPSLSGFRKIVRTNPERMRRDCGAVNFCQMASSVLNEGRVSYFFERKAWSRLEL